MGTPVPIPPTCGVKPWTRYLCRLVNDYFRSLARLWSEEASKRGASVAPPELEPAIAEEILQLARVVAHSKERSFAPLASFTAGVAAERLRAAKGADSAAIAAYVREVREALESDSGGAERGG